MSMLMNERNLNSTQNFQLCEREIIMPFNQDHICNERKGHTYAR